MFFENMDKIVLKHYNTTMENVNKGFRRNRKIVLPIEELGVYLQNPLVQRLYLTDVGFFSKAVNHTRVRREGIDEYILLYCVDGSGDIWVENKHFHLTENEAFCIPSHSKHRYCACEKDPWSILWVHFKGSDVSYYPLNSYRVIRPISSMENRMLSLFELLFSALDDDYSLGNFIYLSQVLALILAELYQRSSEESASGQNRYLTRIIHYMYKHINSMINLNEICEQMHISKSYINALFQQYAHCSPLQFFVNIKMTEACKMLKATDLCIYEVAQKLGYTDPYYFSRIFKKKVGVSPKSYQKGDYFYREK